MMNKSKVDRRKENETIKEFVSLMTRGIYAHNGEIGAKDELIVTKHEDKIYTIKLGKHKFRLNIEVEDV